MTEKIVTIVKYDSYIDADIAKQHLESAGIKAMVSGSNTANVYSICGIAKAELLVFEKDKAAALEVLKDQERED